MVVLMAVNWVGWKVVLQVAVSGQQLVVWLVASWAD